MSDVMDPTWRHTYLVDFAGLEPAAASELAATNIDLHAIEEFMRANPACPVEFAKKILAPLDT